MKAPNNITSFHSGGLKKKKTLDHLRCYFFFFKKWAHKGQLLHKTYTELIKDYFSQNWESRHFLKKIVS